VKAQRSLGRVRRAVSALPGSLLIIPLTSQGPMAYAPRFRAWRMGLLYPAALLLGCTWQAQAVQSTISQVGPPTWIYDITFAPLDNYSIIQANTTITITSLTGVTAAAGPTSTDFPTQALNETNLAWTAQVLNGGTTVVWTHVGPGTGNFSTPQHIFGFSTTAPGATNCTVAFSTSGFSRDISNPLLNGTHQGAENCEIQRQNRANHERTSYQAGTGGPPTYSHFKAAVTSIRIGTQSVTGLFSNLATFCDPSDPGVCFYKVSPSLYQNLLSRAPTATETSACDSAELLVCFETLIGYPLCRSRRCWEPGDRWRWRQRVRARSAPADDR